ncbi:CAZyme family AA11 [Paecilomyces variotii]|nr:CAZyme family AA11 [Paecilomyces variotii]KAJ9312024.1 CAZyme family AA11 [Paecilomyces variotii]
MCVGCAVDLSSSTVNTQRSLSLLVLSNLFSHYDLSDSSGTHQIDLKLEKKSNKMFSKSIIAVAAVLSASFANAHIIMTKPVPYGLGTLNNSPLDASGSDFPCKIREQMWDNEESARETNTFKIGEPQTLAFKGIATHGGGSCQVSLTTDEHPTKDSKWMVIHSIEGGCPIQTAGNLVGSADTPVPNTFQFSIPDGISAGNYTLAWTWFNRVGNREMYMNCAPIAVTAGSQKRDESSSQAISKRDSFPPMFVANINGCTTPENVNIRFPDPGDSLELAGLASELLALGQPACSGGPGPGPSSAAPSGTSPGASPATSAAASSASQSSVATSAPETTPTGAPGIFASGASPIASAMTATVSVVSAGPSSTPSSSASSSGALSGACSPEGTWNCINGSSFQRCASGNWSSPIDMASGTTCTAGKSDSLKVAAVKRSPRVPAGHLHPRRHIGRLSHL